MMQEGRANWKQYSYSCYTLDERIWEFTQTSIINTEQYGTPAQRVWVQWIIHKHTHWPKGSRNKTICTQTLVHTTIQLRRTDSSSPIAALLPPYSLIPRLLMNGLGMRLASLQLSTIPTSWAKWLTLGYHLPQTDLLLYVMPLLI